MAEAAESRAGSSRLGGPRLAGLVVLAALAAAALAFALLHRSSAKGPAEHAQVSANGQGPVVDVWKIRSNGELIFQWHGDSDALTFDPATRTLRRIEAGAVSQVDHYRTSATAWAAVKVAYGLTRDEVTSGLARGTRSAAPAAVRLEAKKAGDYATSGDYGSNFKALSAAIGFRVPEVTSLEGYPLLGTSVSQTYGPGKEPSSGRFAAIDFGSRKSGNSAISITIARRSKPGSWGTIDSQMYAEKKFHHFAATPTCPAYTLVAGDAVAPYRAEWMGVHVNVNRTRRGWCRLLRTLENG